ncbi:SRPBCC family protein [Streptomyces tsukubensis]|uniref:SRPBCC family protein n=1 Tax=Streptomyces tsukubensis TaxID=83656 RepID=A0A1V4A979_9ACTN|nr:SRPBCC family protein [Streptomyces tsukubensis]OON78818.1 hypothetical protein B1H18_15740 [Streptomyces tsukubensis]QFR94295.1 SRPBCC family protein [Streptomyces tsukubensis]
MATVEPVEAVAEAWIARRADEIWEIVADFDGLAAWHPLITSSDLVAGGVREVRTEGGGRVTEELVDSDPATMTLRYRLGDHDFPLRDHLARITVEPEQEGARVRWSATFVPTEGDGEAMRKAFAEGTFAPGLQALATARTPDAPEGTV